MRVECWRVGTLMICLSALGILAIPGHAHGQCSPGIKVADTCSGITYKGCCLPDATLHWCEGGVLCAIFCADNVNPAYQKCGWSPTDGFYNCGSSTLPDPTCTHPYDCPGNCVPCAGISYQGCCDGLLLKWCECGCLRTIDCSLNAYPNNSCGWNGNEGFYDCGQLGADPSGAHPIDCSGGPCIPSCGGKQCGDDGCGGSCGTCPAGYVCNAAGLCEVGTCTPSCAGKQCGSDGCGGSCGTCPEGQTCNAYGQCVSTCVPNCTGKQCGSDGCGGSCGTCPEGQVCNAAGRCVASCTPDCAGKECGDDGCGGTCGSCTHGYTCQFGTCVEVQPCSPDCTDRECGPDGCGGSCGVCQPPLDCNAAGQCYDPTGCSPSCVGRVCGPDGCGGSCGTCPAGQRCNAFGQCEATGLPDTSPDETTLERPTVGEDSFEVEDAAAGCPPGTISYYGTCKPVSPGEDATGGGPSGGGCKTSLSAIPAWWSLLFLSMVLIRRIRGPISS